MKIIHTDNYGGDYPDEKFVENIPRMGEAECQSICDIINAWQGQRYYKVVPDDYRIAPGFEP